MQGHELKDGTQNHTILDNNVIVGRNCLSSIEEGYYGNIRGNFL
jgi:hypothetical protein